MTRYVKLVNGEEVEMTTDEIAARQTEEAAAQTSMLLNHLPAYRYKREIGGITVNGISVKTDEDTQRKLIAIRIEAANDPNYELDFKAVSGWVTLNAAQSISLADAVSAHVKKCFKAERTINISQYTTTEQIEAAFDAAYSEL